ncbi:MAG: DedA family protein [Candidatus Gracilibacteria bacterium]|nr:DedA family protein [Candidatus Gracilibacteria bacterium]MDD2908820.1 DedA family protein [Candidatus Gracilibacteria bacterium]
MKNLKQKLLSGFIKILNFIFIGITIALLIIAIFRPDLVKDFLAWLKIVIAGLGNWNFLIAFLSSIIESFPVIGILVPGMQVMLMVGGVLGEHSLLQVIIVAIIGAIIGNYIGYILGVKYGDKFFKNYGEWFGLGKTELKILKNQIQKNGAIFIIFGKFHNFTRAFVPFIAGSMGMKQKHFWFYNIVGSIIWATTIISIGVFFINNYDKIIDNIEYIMLGIFLVTAIYIAIFKRKEFTQYIKDKNAELDEKLSEKNNK